MKKAKAIVLVDGQNFLNKVNEVIDKESVKPSSLDILNIQLRDLITNVFQPYKDINIKDIYYYSAKIRMHPKTKKKSYQLIANHRQLKNNLEKQGIKCIKAGNVRAQEEKAGKGKTKITFKEKGVDVRISVDMVSFACDKKYDVLILCSSDSDIQPAVSESRKRGSQVYYLGFAMSPNKGLMYTTN